MPAARSAPRTRLSRAELFVLVLCFVCSVFVIIATQTVRDKPSAPVTAAGEGPSYKPHGRWDGEQICSTVDVVYTWVNGSDPIWLREMTEYKSLYNKEHNLTEDEDGDTATSSNRFRDNDELK